MAPIVPKAVLIVGPTRAAVAEALKIVAKSDMLYLYAKQFSNSIIRPVL
jgi:hypothetical protein